MKENEKEKDYEYLYTLDNFLKFERKIYQFAGLPFGRPIKMKFVLYFLLIGVTVTIWYFTPVIGLVIKWIPFSVLLAASLVSAWLLTDIGTENRNPLKYFKSFFGYQKRRLKQVTYYRGKVISKLKDYDMSGHTLFNLPSQHPEVNHLHLYHLEESNVLEPVNEDDMLYVSNYKPQIEKEQQLKYQQIVAAQYTPLLTKGNAIEVATENIVEEIAKPNIQNIIIPVPVPILEQVEAPITLIKELPSQEETEPFETTLDSVILVEETQPIEISESVKKERNTRNLPILFPILVSEKTEITVPISESIAPVLIESTTVSKLSTEEPFTETFTPVVRNLGLDTSEKLKLLEPKAIYLKINEINKLSSKEKETPFKEKKSFVAKWIERLIDALVKRKQLNRYKKRNKKGRKK